MYCPNCNQENPDNQVICQRCGATIRAATPSVELEKPEKVLNGILGALIGALIGGAHDEKTFKAVVPLDFG